MSLTLPTSMQQIVGDRFLRLGTSYDNTKFFIDIPASRDNSNRSRFTYTITNGIVSGSYNLNSLLGATVLAIELVVDSVGKIVFTTNPTGTKIEKSIIYISYTDEEVWFLLTEDEDFILQENGDRLILEYGLSLDDTTLTDAANVKNIFSATDSDTRFFVIQESDF